MERGAELAEKKEQFIGKFDNRDEGRRAWIRLENEKVTRRKEVR